MIRRRVGAGKILQQARIRGVFGRCGWPPVNGPAGCVVPPVGLQARGIASGGKAQAGKAGQQRPG